MNSGYENNYCNIYGSSSDNNINYAQNNNNNYGYQQNYNNNNGYGNPIYYYNNNPVYASIPASGPNTNVNISEPDTKNEVYNVKPRVTFLRNRAKDFSHNRNRENAPGYVGNGHGIPAYVQQPPQ